jgi:1,4-dihydroxy-2-naphthoate octaprenyltransferase
VKNSFFQNILTALAYTFLVVILSYLCFGPILNAVSNYSTAEASYHLPTHALLVGIIFTVIICTILLLEEIKKR